MTDEERKAEVDSLIGELTPLDTRVVEEDLSEIPVERHAETRVRAGELLLSLVGQSLETASGSANRIIEVVNGTAIVQTDRSPAGQPVPVRWVQSALDTLWADGEAVIHPESVGYRSAFIGAVLRTLPGATIGGSPPMVRLERPSPISATPEVEG